MCLRSAASWVGAAAPAGGGTPGGVFPGADPLQDCPCWMDSMLLLLKAPRSSHDMSSFLADPETSLSAVPPGQACGWPSGVVMFAL